MATTKWAAPEAIQTALTTELNSLGNGSTSSASATVDNETDLYPYIDLELALASLTPTGAPTVDVYLICSLDGTNYDDLSTNNLGTYLASFAFSTATTAKRCVLRNLIIPPLKFKIAVANNAGVSLAATSNTVKYRRHAEATA